MKIARLLWIVLTVTALWAAPGPAVASKSQQHPNASIDDTPLLRKRFLAAIYAAKRPESLDHAESLIEVLRNLEQDFQLQLHTREMIEAMAPSQPAIEKQYLKKPKGIAASRPIETSRAFAKKGPLSGWLVDAIQLTAECLPEEASYNLRYLDYLKSQPWPGEYLPLFYALTMRMQKRGCIAEHDFASATHSLVPVLRKAMLADGMSAGDAGTFVYLFFASGRGKEVPRALLKRYLAAQQLSGTWEGKSLDDSAVLAAQGAYVLAAVLKARAVSVTPPEIYYAEANKPVLPPPAAY